MKLDELRKKLYKPEADFEERLKTPEILGREQDIDLSKDWEKIEKKKLSVKQKKYLRFGIISAGSIFLIAIAFLVWHGLTSFDKDKVELEIKGPERIISGEEVVYRFSYKNNTRLSLKDIKLIFRFPEDSIPLNDSDSLIQDFDLPDLESEAENQIDLPVRIIGLKGEEKILSAELSYQPGNISSRFNNQAEFLIKIISVPLILDFDLPEKLVDGQTFDFSVRYINQADVSFDDLQVQIEYPAGFSFMSSEPKPLEGENNIWPIKSLMAGQEERIFIQGSIQGAQDETKPFKAQMGILKGDNFIPYAKTTDAINISLSPLFVSQKINDSVDYIAYAGDQLNYQINYKNTTDVGIRNVVITSKLESRVLDFASLDLDKGSFDGETQTITWRAGNLPDLEYLSPHQEGQINFSIKIKDILPVNNYNDKNFTISNTVKIDSSETPFSLQGIEVGGQNQIITKLASKLVLQAQGYYYDDLISNSGPIPPKVGQKTTYTIKWRLINISNDLSRIKIEAFLPPHVQWLGRVSPANINLEYKSQTGQVVWEIDDLPSATGVLLPVKQAAFQVAIVPSLAHRGNLMELIGQSKVTAMDNFVDLELISTDEPIDTDLPDDASISRKDGTVIE